MFATRVRELRKERGMTQKQLADILFIDQTAVSYWEQGKTKPDYERQKTLADFFEVSVDYLMGRTNHPQVAPDEPIDEANLPHENTMFLFGTSGTKQKITLSQEEMEQAQDMLKKLLPDKFKLKKRKNK